MISIKATNVVFILLWCCVERLLEQQFQSLLLKAAYGIECLGSDSIQELDVRNYHMQLIVCFWPAWPLASNIKYGFSFRDYNYRGASYLFEQQKGEKEVFETCHLLFQWKFGRYEVGAPKAVFKQEWKIYKGF